MGGFRENEFCGFYYSEDYVENNGTQIALETLLGKIGSCSIYGY